MVKVEVFKTEYEQFKKQVENSANTPEIRHKVFPKEKHIHCINQWLKRFILTLFILLLFYPTNVFSASLQNKHPLLLVSQRGSVFIVINEKEAADLTAVIAKMEHDIHALEVVFRQMLDDGRLDERHQTLVINVGFNGSAKDRFLNAPTRLYRVNQTTLFGYHSLQTVINLRKPGTISGKILNLGKAYVIDTSAELLTLNDLLAFIHLLPEVDGTPAVKEIRNEEELLAAKKQIPSGLVDDMTFAVAPHRAWRVHVREDYFSAIWRGGVVTYYLRTTKEGEKRPPCLCCRIIY